MRLEPARGARRHPPARAGRRRYRRAARRGRGADRVPGQYIVVFRGSVDNVSAETDQREARQGFRAKARYRRALKGFSAKLSPRQVERPEADPEVAFVSPDREVRAVGPLAAGDRSPSGVRRMGAGSNAEARSASGANVAVIDTGIDLDHPDLNAAAGKNCVGSGSPEDDNGHGTHVAGSIAARNNGSGLVGVAPDTKVYAAKVLDSQGGGTWSQIICGIDWATATRTDSDPTNDIAVANMSLGGSGSPVGSCGSTTDALHKAICNSTTAGVNYVVAAGNDGWDFDYASLPDVPAAYPQVLTVAAASDSDGQSGGAGGAPTCRSGEEDDRYASFSNYAKTTQGQQHTVAAPGVCIDSTWIGNGYKTISGTSMAAPHIAGEVALCLDEGGTSGPCAGLASDQVIQKVRDDAKATSEAHTHYGFTGDPLRPLSGKYFGHLAWGGAPGTAPPPAPTLKTYQPAGYTLASGSVYSKRGALSRLFHNDGSRVEITAKSGSPYVAEIRPYATITAAERASLKKLSVDYDGHASTSGAAVSLRIYNFRTGQWKTLDGPRTGVTSDRAFSWSDSTTPADFVSAGGEVRFSVLGTRSSGFRINTDLVRFRIEH